MAQITKTVLIVSSTGDRYELDGVDFTASKLKELYSGNIPGLESMTSNEAINGSVRTVTFSPRQGQKG